MTKMPAIRVRYHEAGHAVVARLLGVPVTEVTAREQRKFRGLTLVNLGNLSRNRSFHEKQIKILLAGSLSESKQFPDVDWEEIQGNCTSDWSELYAHAHEIVGIRGLPKPKRVNIMHLYPATIGIVDAIAQETDALIAG
jgi:ATP-dependent Zn protease